MNELENLVPVDGESGSLLRRSLIVLGLAELAALIALVVKLVA